MPSFSQTATAARLQQLVATRREEVGLYREIAEQLLLPDSGRLLDVGTGSGLQLRVIRELKPHLELYGLDISSAAIHVAQRNLEGFEADLRVGSIENTSYHDNTFDLVTCHSSMSYWKNPISCFDEIHRILKHGGAAVLFEPQKDIDIDKAVDIITANLADKSALRRLMAGALNKFALRYGGRLGLRLYAIDELEEIASRSRFANHTSIEGETLQNLPIFVRITLRKARD